MPPDNKGGRRPGAGRPPGKVKRRPYSITMSAAEHAEAERVFGDALGQSIPQALRGLLAGKWRPVRTL